MRFALDSNIIVYAEGLNDIGRRDTAIQLALALGGLPVIIPVQVLGECLNVFIRKGKIQPTKALQMLDPWRDGYALQATTSAVLSEAFAIVQQRGLAVWDAIILAAAVCAHADTLFTDDLQDGFVWKSTTVVNPFLPYPAPIVRALLGKD